MRSRGPLVTSPALPPVQPTARTGRRRKAKAPLGGEGLGAALPHLAAVALQHPPARSAGARARRRRGRGRRRACRARAASPCAAHAALLDRLAARRRRRPARPAGAPCGRRGRAARSAFAGPVPARARGRGSGQPARRVSGRASQLRQRHRLRRPHREDQLPPGLGEVGVLRAAGGGRAPPAGREQQRARGERGGAQDLAGGGDQRGSEGGLRDAVDVKPAGGSERAAASRPLPCSEQT